MAYFRRLYESESTLQSTIAGLLFFCQHMDIKTRKNVATIVADNPPRTHKLKMVRRQKQQPNERAHDLAFICFKNVCEIKKEQLIAP